MTEQVILTPVPLNELLQAFAEQTKDYIDRAFNEILSAQPSSSNAGTQLLTRKQTAEILGISLPTLHTWTKDSIIKSFKIGRAIRYKQEDVYHALNEQQFGTLLTSKTKL